MASSSKVHYISQNDVARFREKLKSRSHGPVDKGPTGPQPPDMEARVAKLESALDHVQTDLTDIKTDIRELRANARTDFRMLFGAIITLALLTAGGFVWMNERLLTIIERLP